MAKYRVASGEMDRIVTAATAVDAVAIAVRLEHESDAPAELSTIIEAIEIAAGPFVFDTETVCRVAGVWANAATHLERSSRSLHS